MTSAIQARASSSCEGSNTRSYPGASQPNALAPWRTQSLSVTSVIRCHEERCFRPIELAACTSCHSAPRSKRYRAAGRLALELQRDLVPAAVFATTASRDFFSARIGCQVYHPVWGMDFAALCLRK
jgi:hypothetical protein